jgi:hypothetical protein
MVEITSKLDLAGSEILQSLRHLENFSGELWLCRGAVRCILLNELQPWDDFDAIVSMPPGDLDRGIKNASLNPTRTFHGGYSFILPEGRKLDVWSLETTMRGQPRSIDDALSKFEFNVDAVAWSVFDKTITDPLNVLSEITARKLRLLNPARENPYLPLKAAYLLLRHNFKPDKTVTANWKTSWSAEDIPQSAIIGLQQQLRWLNITKDGQQVRGVQEEYPEISQYLKVLLP